MTGSMTMKRRANPVSVVPARRASGRHLLASWRLDGQLIAASTPLSRAERYTHSPIHPKGNAEYWSGSRIGEIGVNPASKFGHETNAAKVPPGLRTTASYQSAIRSAKSVHGDSRKVGNVTRG